MFQHTEKDKQDALKNAEGELKNSSNALVAEQMNYLKLSQEAKNARNSQDLL